MASQQLYFAYGSNLHLGQMRRRCPESKYIGTGRLMNYKWQINQRGFANVIKADGYWVDGLVYDISPSDEVRLDMNEGVSSRAYDRMTLPIEVERAEVCLYRRPTAWIVANGGAEVVRATARSGEEESPPPKSVEPEVLVYVSEEFIDDGEPRDEYIQRMNAGLKDALVLGIDPSYIDNVIRPSIPLREEPKPEPSSQAE